MYSVLFLLLFFSGQHKRIPQSVWPENRAQSPNVEAIAFEKTEQSVEHTQTLELDRSPAGS